MFISTYRTIEEECRAVAASVLWAADVTTQTAFPVPYPLWKPCRCWGLRGAAPVYAGLRGATPRATRGYVSLE